MCLLIYQLGKEPVLYQCLAVSLPLIVIWHQVTGSEYEKEPVSDMTCWVNTTKKLLESHQTLPHSTGTAGDETNLTHAVPICLPSHTYHKTTIIIIILHSKLHSLNKGTFILKCGHIVNGVGHFICTCTLYIVLCIQYIRKWSEITNIANLQQSTHTKDWLWLYLLYHNVFSICLVYTSGTSNIMWSNTHNK